MKKNLEKGIRFKAAFLYIISIVGIVAMIFYINDLRKDVYSYKQDIEHQHKLLSTTNDLVYNVSEAQSLSGLFLLTKKNSYKKSFDESVDSIKVLIDSLIIMKPSEEENLLKIETLLRNQSNNISRLNRQLRVTNPVNAISEQLKEYQEPLKNDTLIVTVHNDTLLNEVPRKGFFRRIGEVFKPSKDSMRIVINQRTDTVRSQQLKDSLEIIYDKVENIAQQAEIAYDQSIRNIERQINTLISADKEISVELSALLLQLHRQTLDSTVSIIENSEASISRNYKNSIIGGIIALLLILIFITLIITDVNQGYKARKELEHANDIIKDTMESRHKLLLSVSHDIKSPLNSISGYLDFMQEDESVRSMKNSASHILSMLENLLDFSSLEQGKLKKSTSDFSLNTLFTDIYDMFLPLASRKELELSFKCDDIRINADQMKLKQLIINLVSNAIKYTTEGEIRFTAEYEERNLVLSVTDTGAGIPENKLTELYKPFSRIEENNKLAHGSGLGLFVVKGIVDLFEGKIEYDSEIDMGTTVTVTFPTEISDKQIPKGAKRIRVYDDDPVILRVVSDMLSSLGHIVTDEDCDMIITDMEMGDITGIDILRQAGDKPVIVMTGKSDYSTDIALETGFTGYLPKPVSPESLRNMIGEGESFEDFLGDDFSEIVELFRLTSKEDMQRLRDALGNNDFRSARAVCHKMLPMFTQLGYRTDELIRIDINKDNEYDNWQKDVEAVLATEI